MCQSEHIPAAAEVRVNSATQQVNEWWSRVEGRGGGEQGEKGGGRKGGKGAAEGRWREGGEGGEGGEALRLQLWLHVRTSRKVKVSGIKKGVTLLGHNPGILKRREVR